MSRFDQLASEWDLRPQRVQSAKNVSQKLRSLIPLKDQNVLDYGAGTGLIAFDLCEDVHTVTAMDNSHGMLEEIEKKAQKAGIDNVITLYHDINDTHLPKQQYDLFVSSMTMHHIPDTKAFLKKAKESLKKEGYIAINDLESEDGSFHSMGNDDVAHFGFDKEQIKRIFEELELEVVFMDTVEIISKKRDYPVFLIVGKNV